MRLKVIGITLITCFTLISCREEIVPEIFKPSIKHKAYIVSLQSLNLDETALGKDWIESSESAISNPVRIETPYEEAFYLDPNEADAVGYRFSVKRGQKVVIDVFASSPDSVLLFIDLFRVVSDSLKRWTHVATADENLNKLAFEPRQDSEYVLRLQPELLRGGRYTITIRRVPTLLFPVAGKDSRAIGSFFGDPRDGGRRDHHGVDIFARRYTPIIAPVKGYVRRVGEQSLGGKIIWIRDRERGTNLYFAHLQEQLVQVNTWVEPGDTIGTVGNSGNARYTPTHLHFGIYSRGPRDPYYYLKELNQETAPIEVNLEIIGTVARLSETQTFLSSVAPTGSSEIDTDTIWQNQVFKIIGAFKSFYKVRTQDSRIAYIPGPLIESTLSPLDNEIVLAKEYPLLIEPSDDAISKTTVPPGEQIELLGHSNEYLWVRTPSGHVGWINAEVMVQ